VIKKLILISALVVISSAFISTQSASAHFFVEDPGTGLKAFFHVTPDHNPIAGEESFITFDFSKTGVEAKNYTYSLIIKSTKGEPASVPIEISGNVAIAHYSFPYQGFYDIKLVATNKIDGSTSMLHYGQRVSRGVVATKSMGLGPIEIAAIAGTVLIASIGIVLSFINDRSKRKEKK
jgi:hypothetical protein